MRKRVVLLVLLMTCLLTFLSVLFFKDILLDLAVRKVQESCKQRFHAELKISAAELDGIRNLHFRGLTLVPEGKDTLLKINDVKLKLGWGTFIRMRPEFQSMVIDTASISLVGGSPEKNNFSFILKGEEQNHLTDEKAEDEKNVEWNNRFTALLDPLFSLLDNDVSIHRFELKYFNGKVSESVLLPELFIQNGNIQSSLVTSSKEGVNLWIVKGNYKDSEELVELGIKRTRGGEYALPLIDLFDGFKACFDSLHMNVQFTQGSDLVLLNINAEIFDLLANHWRLASNAVRIPGASLTLNGFANADNWGFGKGTMLKINQLPIEIESNFSSRPEKTIRLKTAFELKDADMFFNSLPIGMFGSLDGIKTTGGLKFNMDFSLPLDKPQNLVFDAELRKKDFRLKGFGKENFSRINQSFVFDAMDGDRWVRSFVVGPENPSFTPLGAISPDLINAVLICEDPSFLVHNGFIMESFRESIATNLQKKRFARGGSTISMQLVKNVFLSRNKSIARKLEEVLIVWIMEQNRLVSKERMLEIYLNIIEWGPDIYGISEASRFYFDKAPAELNLKESIFLASLIPSPKSFRYRFDSNRQLKPYMQHFFQMVANRMARKELIPAAAAEGMVAEIQLNGSVLQMLQTADSAQNSVAVPDSSELLPVLNEN